MITVERERVVSKTDCTPEHDAMELEKAARCYFGRAISGGESGVRASWPWDDEFWKADTPIRMLVKVGQFIAAEIDRRKAAGDKA